MSWQFYVIQPQYGKGRHHVMKSTARLRPGDCVSGGKALCGFQAPYSSWNLPSDLSERPLCERCSGLRDKANQADKEAKKR